MKGHHEINISEAQRANLKTLADYLLALPPDYDHFDMESFVNYKGKIQSFKISPDFSANRCGTVACAAGHGPDAGIKPLESDKWLSYIIRCFTGKSERIFDWCFDGSWKYVDNTSDGAARRILYMLEYGIPYKYIYMIEGEVDLPY